jgi:hypothetical protein
MGVVGHPHFGQGGWLSHPSSFFFFSFPLFFFFSIFFV